MRRALVKQIRNCELVENLMDRGDSYFHWLQKKSDLTGPLSSMLADTEFVSIDGLDDILKDKAKEETREKYAEEMAENPKDIKTVIKSIRGECCVFEVILCLADSINEMFEDLASGDGTAHFFKILMSNALFDKYDEEDFDMHPDTVKAYWEKCIKRILDRTYSDIGELGLFPVPNEETYSDRRRVSLWQQLNDWVDIHTNEDGEWVD